MSKRSERKPPKKAGNSPEELESGDDAIIGTAFWLSLTVIAVFVPCVGGTIWYLSRAPVSNVTEATALQPPTKQNTSAIEIPHVHFTDITKSHGLAFKHYTGARGEKLLPETMGGGCAFIDFDNDGDADILMVNGCDWPWTPVPETPQPTLNLFRNDGTGHFENVTAESGLEVSIYGMGAAVGDYDNDAWPDLFISCVGRDRLFHNDHGKFRDVTDEMGVGGDDEQWGTSCCWFDFDNDGDLDLFVGNYVQWSRKIDLSLHSTLDGKQRSYGPPLMFQGTFPYLYRNDNNKFVDVTADAGLQIRHRDTGVPVAKTMGVVPADLDFDGFIDLVVANDTVQNFLFHNLGNGKFEEVANDSGIAFDQRGDARGAMGIDAACPRNDRCWTLVIGNFSNEMTSFFMSPKTPMHFFDAATATGLGPATRLSLTFGVLFVDFDLDGRLDLLCANGHLEENINKVQETQFYAQPPKLYWNCGYRIRPEYIAVPAKICGEQLGERMVGRGSAVADIDNDGDLDFLIAGSGSEPRLLRNDNDLGHHWLRVKLVGKSCNRDAIGATIDLHVNGTVLPRYVNPCRSYLSQSELPVTFGLGTETSVEKLVVTWPGGQKQTITDLPVDRLMVIEQPSEIQ